MHVASVSSDPEVLKGPPAFCLSPSDVPVAFLPSWFANFFRQELFYSAQFLSGPLAQCVGCGRAR